MFKKFSSTFLLFKYCCLPKSLRHLQALLCIRKKLEQDIHYFFDKRELKSKPKIPNVVLHVKKEYFYLHKKITTIKENMLTPNFLGPSKIRW